MNAAPREAGSGVGPEELREIGLFLERASPADVLRWAVENFAAERLALASAFGPGTAVLIHLLAEIAPKLPVIFVDTLHHFPETLEHVERVRAHYGLNLRVVRPAPTLADFEARHGPRLWERDLERYQQLAKIGPFRQATAGLDAWITGRRRDQAPTRRDLPVLEIGDRTRINPLAVWTRRQVWEFIDRHKLPFNPLHDLGYASVGDAPLTAPTAPGEHERAGRWPASARVECGIHGG
jgi:phosphoadenosine phosphosulfate reductase